MKQLMLMKTTLSRVMAVCGAMAFLTTAQATLFDYDAFDYTGTALSGQSGGTGWSGGWFITTGNSDNGLSNDATSLAYPTSFDPSLTPPTPTGSRVVTGGLAKQANDTRLLSQTIPLNVNGTIRYASALFQKGVANGTANDNVLLQFYDGSGDRRWGFGIASGKPWLNANGSTSASTSVTPGNTYFMVAKIVVSGGTDYAYLKVYGTGYGSTVPAAEPATWDATITDTTAAVLDRVQLRVDAGATSANPGVVDEIRIADTWLEAVSVPPPIVPPAIVSQPASLTNAYVGDNATFAVLATGTSPLIYQWYYTNSGVTTALDTTANPTAATTSLALNSVGTGNAGYYFVVVTNGSGPGTGGAVTSAVAQLAVHTYTPPSTSINGNILQLEFNAVASPANVQPGFQSMTLASSSAVFNGATKVTISSLNTTPLADRDRNSAAVITNNPPALTTAFLYNSFVFANSAVIGAGIDILIQHLAPNTAYGVNLWSFDEASNGARISDWAEFISSTTIASKYTFDGTIHPTNDWQNTFGAVLTSDASGQLDIQGNQNALSAGFGVFLNALTVTVNPAPVIKSAVMGTDGYLLITAQAQYSGQTLYFLESPDLATWHDATDGTNGTQNGPIVTSEFPLSPANKMFYRVATQP